MSVRCRWKISRNQIRRIIVGFLTNENSYDKEYSLASSDHLLFTQQRGIRFRYHVWYLGYHRYLFSIYVIPHIAKRQTRDLLAVSEFITFQLGGQKFPPPLIKKYFGTSLLCRSYYCRLSTNTIVFICISEL